MSISSTYSQERGKNSSANSLSNMVCPKCGYQAKGSEDPLLTKHNGMGECPQCGIIPKKYLLAQKINKINENKEVGSCVSEESTYEQNPSNNKQKHGIFNNFATIVFAALTMFIVGTFTAFLVMQINTNSILTIKSDQLASKAIDEAQKLAFRIEVGINFRDYSSVVLSDLAISVKTYLASNGAADNPELTSTLSFLLKNHLEVINIWKKIVEHRNYKYFLNFRAMRENIGSELHDVLLSKYHRYYLSKSETEEVMQLIWQNTKSLLLKAKKLNGNT